jgi:adenylate kinase family enzyme
MQRVSVVGVSGAGKTTVGRKLAAALGVAFVELDAIFHQPDWVELPHDDFRERVHAALATPGWVVDGNYSMVRDLVWDRADTVVWLDLPRRLVMRRVILRTLRRAVTPRGAVERQPGALDQLLPARSREEHHPLGVGQVRHLRRALRSGDG